MVFGENDHYYCNNETDSRLTLHSLLTNYKKTEQKLIFHVGLRPLSSPNLIDVI